MKQFRFTTGPITSTSLALLLLLSGIDCGRLPRSNVTPQNLRTTEAPFRININTAAAQELEQLPGVGKVIAERIVAYREQYGRFRRPEELLMVNGISDKKFRELQALIVVE
jgi:competence ComEA-like helix-hairpin-helix protein